MAEYILSIANASTCPQTSISTGSSTNISIPFTATITPDVDMDEVFVSITQLPINVSGGLCWAGNNGSRRLTINSITLKSTDTTYATYDTPFQVSGNHGSGDKREVQLIVTNPNTLLKDLSTKSISIVMNLTNNGGGDTWAPGLSINAQDISLSTLTITAGSPQQICGEHYPSFNLSATSNATPDPLTYQWEYSEHGLNSWTSINTPSTSLDYTWIVNDPSIGRGKTYDVAVKCTEYNFMSNIVEITLYDAPSIPDGINVTPKKGSKQTYVRLNTTPVTDPSDGVCPLQYQWEYNDGVNDKWQALGGATALTYMGLFIASSHEIQFRLRVIGAGGAGYSDPVTYTAYYPTYPLNVEIGSPQYITVSQINYSVGTYSSVQVTPASPDTTPVSNSYYTFQSQDGQYWITGYVGNWMNNDGAWIADIIWSSSNTDSLPAQSICWCVWAKEYYDSLTTYIGNINIGIPSGCIIPYGGTTIPSGWLLCDGSSISTDTYPDLFNAIKYTYGGSGSSFNLPNLTGRMPLGVSESHVLGTTGGDETVTLTTDQMPSHNHPISCNLSNAGVHEHNMASNDVSGNNRGYVSTSAFRDGAYGYGSTGTDSYGYNGNTYYVSTNFMETAGEHTHTLTATIDNIGSGQPHNNMPPFLTLNFIIKT